MRKRIAVIISDRRYEGQTLTVRGILDTAEKYGLESYIFTCDSTWEQKDRRGSVLPLFHARDYEGIVFHGDTIENPELVESLVKEILDSGVPAVSIKDTHEGMPLAGMDNYTGIREIVHYLVKEKGVRTINYVSGIPASTDSRERYEAFCSAMEEMSIPVDPERVKTGFFNPQGGVNAFRSWYENRDRLPLPDAYVCASDWMAFGVIEEARRCGLTAPKDFLITGFDNILVSRVSDPPLTTVQLPNDDIGALAVERLWELMKTGKVTQKERISNHAIFRESVGAVSRDPAGDGTRQELRERFYYDSLYRANYMDILKAVQMDLTGATNWKEFYRHVGKAARVFDADAFFLCTTLPHRSRSGALAELMDKEERMTYTGEVKVPVALVKGEERSFERFRDSSLMSEEMRQAVEGRYYAFLPLHYQSHQFGYCIVCNSEVAYENEFYSLFMQSISSAMENLWQKFRLSKMIDILDELWIYDKLTGVLNRAGFEREAPRLIKEAEKAGDPLFVLFIDMDGLKTVNDTMGHDQGDAYIMEVATILRKIHKRGELLMRYGGDEFVVLARGYSEEEAEKYCEAIREAEEEANQKELPFRVSISTGYVRKKADKGFSLEEAIEEADQKMYVDKQKRKQGRE